jgi:SHS2 domain-containing protein
VGRFAFLEHITRADSAIEVVGEDLGDLFATAASALAESMVDPASLPTDREREVTLTAARLDLLLFDWLSEIVYRKDADGEVFPRAEVRVEGEGPFRLSARLSGGGLVPGTTVTRSDLKAVTLHRFQLEPVDDGWRARFVVDV